MIKVNFSICAIPNFSKSIETKNSFLLFRILNVLVLLSGLFGYQHNANAVDDIPILNWKVEFGPLTDYHYLSGYHGCGTAAGVVIASGYSPKELADKVCAVWQEFYACAVSKGASESNGGAPPSILHQVTNCDTQDVTCREYYYRCTGSVYSPHQGLIGGIASKGLVDAGKNPKNKGLTCPNEGNPINPANGNKFQNETIYGGIAGAINENLDFNISYNSLIETDKKQLGKSWRSPFDRYLSDLTNEVGLVAMARQDGKGYGFQNVNGSMLASSDKTYSLTRLVDGLGATTGWMFVNDITGETENYNAQGTLQSITSRAGNTNTLIYSTSSTPSAIAPQAGLLIKVIDYLGRSISFTYDSTSRILSMTNPQGGLYTYTYDNSQNSNLTSVTYPDSKIKTFHYENTSFPNALTGITDENNDRFATWSYDGRGRAVSSEHAGATEKVTLTYLANGFGETHPISTEVTTVGTGATRTYNWIHSALFGVVKSTGQSQPAGSGCAASASAITYDANGNVASRTDFNGNMTTYSYDMARNLETRRTEGLNAAGNATPATRTITTTWHPTWRLPLVTSEFSGATATGTALRRTTNVYDAKGNLTSIAEADPVRSLTRTTTITYTYSSLVPGLVLSKVVNGPRTDATDTTTYNYYDANATCTSSSAAPLIDPITNTSPPNLGCRGQLQSMTNALGQTTTYDRYNHHGQVEQMTDANGLVTTNTYDLRQRLLSRTVGTQTTSLTYDNAGQVIQLTMPDNSQLNYTYDAAHRLTEVQDTLGNKVTYTLDSEGNRINEVTTDPLGNLAKTITRSYDALNRLQQVTGVE